MYLNIYEDILTTKVLQCVCYTGIGLKQHVTNTATCIFPVNRYTKNEQQCNYISFVADSKKCVEHYYFSKIFVTRLWICPLLRFGKQHPVLLWYILLVLVYKIEKYLNAIQNYNKIMALIILFYSNVGRPQNV